MKKKIISLISLFTIVLFMGAVLVSCGGRDKVVTVEYNAMGGTLPENAPASYVVGSTPDFSEVVPTMENYEFDGWYTDEACTISFSADAVTDTKVVLYAKWSSVSPKIAEIGNVTKGFIDEGYNTLTIDMTNYVNSFDYDIVYTVTSSNTEVVTAEIEDDNVVLKFNKNEGSSNIKIEASLNNVNYATFEFTASPKTYKNIACVGDSLTASTPCYPEYLPGLLGNQYNIGNFGKSGASLTRFTNNDAFGPYTTYGEAEYTASKNFKNADLIIICLGGNDATKLNDDGTPKFDWEAEKIAEEFKRDYLALINEYKKVYPNADIVIMTTNVTFDNNRLKVSDEIKKNNVYPLQKEIAQEAGVKLIDLRQYIEGLDGVSKARLPKSDKVHYTEFGAELIAKFVLSSI